jgi:arylsulfatase A-like enzyme
VRAYLATISYSDAQLGRILDALDASPNRNNTILIVWGDHGWHLGEKHHWRKFALWEEATRVPLFISVPNLSKDGARCDRTVNLMDLYPTLADLSGLPVGEHLQGKSLRPLLGDPSGAWDRPSLTTHGRGNHAVRSGRYRYIRYADGSEELYDHSTDPMEWKNLAADPAHAAAKAELAKHLPQADAPNVPRRAANRGAARVR